MRPFETAFPAPDFVHHSDLKSFALSPAHYKARIDERLSADAEQTDKPSLRFGRVVHSMLFHHHGFQVWDGDRRGNDWKAFKATHANEDIITATEHDEAQRIVEAVRANPDAAKLLEGATFETEFEWKIGGRRCAGRIDAFAPTHVVDLKTADIAKPEIFRWQAMKLFYHSQLAFYLDGMRSIGRVNADAEAFLIVVEKDAPYPVVVQRFTARALEEGRRHYCLWLEQLAVCEHANEWPGYAQSVIDFDVETEVELVFPGEAAA